MADPWEANYSTTANPWERSYAPAAPGVAPPEPAPPAVPPPPLGGSMGEGQPQLGGPQGDYYIPPVPWLGFPGVAKDIKKGAEALDAGAAPKPEDFGIDPRSPDYAQNSGPDTPYGKARADWLARVTSGMLGGEGVQWVTGQPSGLGTGMRWSDLPKDLPPSPEGPKTPPEPPAGGAPQQQLPAPRAAPSPDPWELPPGALAGYGGGPAARASDLATGPAPQEQQKPIVPPKPPRPGATPAEVVEQGAVDAGLERAVAPQEPPPPPAVAQPPEARAPAPPVGPGEEGAGGPPAEIPHETPAEQPVAVPAPEAAPSPYLGPNSEIDPASLGIVPAGDGYVPATPEAIARVQSQQAVADMARPKRAPPAKGPQSLLAWLQARGGVSDPDGELAKMDAQLWRRNKSDKVGFVTPEGEHPDYAREAAEEAGYLPQGATLPDLYAHIDRELRGQPVYTEEGQAQADAAEARRQMLDEIDRMGGGDARRWSADKINAFYQKHAQQAAEAQEAMEGRLDRDAQDLIEMVEDERLRHEIEGLGWSSEGLASPDEDLFSVAGRSAEAAPAGAPGAEGAARPQAGGQAPQARPTVDTVTNVVGATQQHVIPGAERITDRELAERRMAAPKRAGKAQREVGDLPLFSGEHKQGSLFEPEEQFKAPVFYSALTRAVEGITQDRALPAHWANLIKKLPGVKPEEIQWSGVEDWLKGQTKPITRAQLLDYLRANELQVGEVVKGEADRSAYPALTPEQAKQWLRQAGITANPDEDYGYINERDYVDLAHRHMEMMGYVAAPPEPKFASYQLPGGENYREVLITLPAQRLSFDDWQRERGYYETDNPGELEARRRIYEAGATTRGRGEPTVYRSPHWEEPNVVAHVRLNDRTGPNGEKVLHVEEVQSDWHQTGRKQGYKVPKAMPADLSAALMKAWDELHLPGWPTPKDGNDAANQLGSIHADPIADRLGYNLADYRVLASAVPDAPFKTTWPELAMKRVIRWAAENGYDKITWTPGDEQAKRYDLSKHVEAIAYHPDVPGGMSGGRGFLRAVDLENRPVIEKMGVTPEQLPDIIGKEAADRLLAQARDERGWHKLEGAGLVFGGEGMRAFYDKMLPAKVNALVKKWGAKVGQTEIRTMAGEPDEFPPGDFSPEDIAEHGTGVTVPSLDITPSMRQSVMQGQTLFQPPGDIKKPPAPDAAAQLYPAPSPPHDVTLDYDYFRRNANVSGPTAAKAYVLDRGRKDGNEHMVALWPNGDAIEAVTSGAPAFVAFGPRTALMIMAPGTGAVLHHNHPSGRSLSGGDISALGMRGVDTIWAHVDQRLHGIEGYGARLTDGMRKWLGDGAAPGRLLEMNGLVRDIVSDHLAPLVQAGGIDRVAANLLGPHLVNRAISEAGVIDYWYDPLLDRGVASHEAFGEALAAATRDLHMALNTLEVHNGPRPARDLGGARDVRPAGNVAGVPAGPGAAGAGGPGQEGAAPVGRQLYRQNPPARRRQPKVDPRQLKLLESGDLREDEPFFDDGGDGEPPRLPPPGGGAAGGRGPLAAARRVWDTIRQSDFIENLMMHMAPSGAPSASDQARAMEKRWADADRVSTMALIHYDATLRKLLPNVADRQFLDAMDEQGVMVQRGEIELGEVRQGYGWGRLNPAQLGVARQLDAYGEALGRAAVELGIFQGTLPHWTPRMLMRMASGSDIGTSGRARARALDQLGVNMRASSPHFMKRKHLTRAETEAAAQLKLGPEAMLVNDVRGMLLAIHGIERAIATRKLINAIKEIGRATGQDTVTTGPRGPGHDFTIPNHPAFLEWRPKLQKQPDGTWSHAVDSRTGQTVFERHALYIRKDFEGPLRAIMQPRPGSFYRGLMQAKSTATTMIMFSPLIHNGVIWGKALEAMPGKAAIFQLYYRGASVKRDHGRMRQLVSRGMAPITSVGPVQDIQQDVMGGGPQIAPGRGLLAKGLRRAIGAIRPEAGDAAARGIDAAGDLWHKKMLWDWVANLQAGMADAMSEHLMRRYPGMARETADTVAGHFANRIAGALPAEAMGRWSRAIANVVLFSRSFNVTTLGTFKDAFGPRWSRGDFRGFGGLPQDTAAKLEEDMGAIQRAMGDSATRRLAQFTILRGILFTIAGYSLLNDALNAILGESIPQLIRDYATRFRDMLSRVQESPLELLNPFGLLESLSSTYWNEPGKQNRVDLGGKPDERHLYGRIPPGKIGEDFMALVKAMTGNFPELLDLLKRKEGTLFKPVLQVIANADDFGRPIYNASDKSMEGVLKATGNMALTLLGAQVPLVSIKGIVDLATGAPNAGRSAIQAFAPLGGVTLSVGDPGGPAAGQVHAVGRDIEYRWREALPSIRDQIRRGDAEGAMARMLALGMAPGLARAYLRSTRVPSRISGRAMQQFMRGSTREQQEKLRILQGEP